jgi:hypothetical protein
MHRKVTSFALALLVALSLGASGCARGFRIQIPGFETAGVLGIWIWRAAADGARFERFARIQFGEREQDEAGVEYLPYTFTLDRASVTLQSPIERSSGAGGDAVTLQLVFPPQNSGTFKISSYNEVGDSPLSEGALVY